MIKTINKLTLLANLPLIAGLIIVTLQPFGLSPFIGIGLVALAWLWAMIMFIIKFIITSKTTSGEDSSSAELKQVCIDHYVNLIRIKNSQKEINPELEYQIKVQKSKLEALGINAEEFE